MGSSGVYSAKVYVSIPLKQIESNSEEVVNEFISKSKIKVIREIDKNDLTKDKILKIFEKTKEIYMLDLEDEDTYEQAIKYNNYNFEDIQDILMLNQKYDENKYKLFLVENLTYNDLKNINLLLLLESKLKYLDSSLEYNETILSSSGSIYYDYDNFSSDSKKVNEKLLLLLSIPGAYINLNTNGYLY